MQDEEKLARSTTDEEERDAGAYGLEQSVSCSACQATIDRLLVIRLYRARVNFMSSLPRSGRVLICPHCRSIQPGELGAVF